jgi:NAD(P)-dependent dehydrogenase (short-subunit alcohol dehydrogenase family)
MLVPRLLLLTGATGLLGRYLLRELLLEGNQVAVLVRNSAASSARDRIRSILRLWNEERGLALPEPRVLSGDLCASGFGLKAADLRWLSRNCKAVVHAGASLAFRTTLENEPFGTNVEGTRNLLNFCRQAGIAEFHHVSIQNNQFLKSTPREIARLTIHMNSRSGRQSVLFAAFQEFNPRSIDRPSSSATARPAIRAPITAFTNSLRWHYGLLNRRAASFN